MSGEAWAFSSGARIPKGVDAQAVGDRLHKLGVSRDGGYTPADVVEDARDPASPLHPAFGDLWDMTGEEAIQIALLHRASYIIRHIRLVTVVETPVGPVREYTTPVVSIIPRETEERRYMPAVRVMSDAEYREQALEDAFRYFWAGRQRFRKWQELARIFAVIDEETAARRVDKAA